MIDPRALDTLVGSVAEAPDNGQVVVDVGSNGFETLMAREVENGVFALLQELGHRVVVQTVIAGGPDAEETVRGTMALLAATDVPVILLLNEHLGPLELHGRPIAEASFLHEARDRILGTILLPARTKATFGKDTEEMLRQRLTFAEAIEQFAEAQATWLEQVSLKDRASFLEEQKALHDVWKADMQAIIGEGQNAALQQVVVQTVALLMNQGPAAGPALASPPAPLQAQALAPTWIGTPWAWIWAGLLLGTGATVVPTLAAAVWLPRAG